MGNRSGTAGGTSSFARTSELAERVKAVQAAPMASAAKASSALRDRREFMPSPKSAFERGQQLGEHFSPLPGVPGLFPQFTKFRVLRIDSLQDLTCFAAQHGTRLQRHLPDPVIDL